MNQTMLERIAQTLHEIIIDNGRDSNGPEEHASAAAKLLLAMREPTENMATAGGEAVPGNQVIHSEVAKDVWRTMIEDAIGGDDG
jgi:hypothetical protein